MPGLDDRIRRGLEALAAGGEGSFEDVARRKGRARLRRRAQAATLVVAVLAGTTGGVVALTRAFGDLDRDRPAGRVEGSLIAFVSNRDGNDEIYTMREDGTGLRNLTRHPADDRDPAWSPDGSMIAFASDRHGGRATSIYVMDGDGSNVRRLTRVAGWVPTWSPDGGSIIFYRGPARSEGAFRIDLDDGEMRPFEPASLPTSPPAWSPDRSTILHVKHLGMWAPFPSYCFGTVGGEVPGLYARDVRSGAERLVAEGNCISQAAWSWRDRLMFTQVVPDELEGPGDPGVHTVLVILERRSGVREEIAFPCDLLDECQLPRVSGASWSPDGRRAVLGVEDGGDSALYTVRGDGSGWRRITPVDWNASDPAWGPAPAPTPVPGPTPTAAPTPTPIFHEICGDLPFPDCNWVVEVLGRAGWVARHNTGSAIVARGPAEAEATVTIGAPGRDESDPTDGSRCVEPFVQVLVVEATIVCADADTIMWATAERLVSARTSAPPKELAPLVEAALALDGRCPAWQPDSRRVVGRLSGDVDGDGVSDEVLLERVPGSAPWCAWWLRVGATMTDIHPDEGDAIVPEVELIGLRQIDDRPGLEIVVQTGRLGSSSFVRVVAWERPPLRIQRGPGIEIGEVGFGRLVFRGVDCGGEDHGTIVVGELIRDGDGSTVLRRRFYGAADAAFRLEPAVTRRQEVPAGAERAALASEFPELRDEPFSSCPRA